MDINRPHARHGGIGRALETRGLVAELGFHPQGNGEPWKDSES